MIKKTTFLYIFALTSLIIFLSGCQTTPKTAPTENIEIEIALPTTISATKMPTATILPAPTEPTLALNAILEEIEGRVEVKMDADTEFSIAENGASINPLGEVRTQEDGYTRIDLSSGSIIRMAPLSHFTLVSNQPKKDSLFTQITLELGQLWVVLNGGSVEIETPSGVAAVRGSYMMVKIDPETQEVLITCLEGLCQLENEMGIVQLFNGQRAKLFPTILPEIEEMRERDFAEWLVFVPEAKETFPLLEEMGLLPWDDWEKYIPGEYGVRPDLDSLFPNIGTPPAPPVFDGSSLPDGSNLPDGENLPGGGLGS